MAAFNRTKSPSSTKRPVNAVAALALSFAFALALHSTAKAQTTIGYVPNADLGDVNSTVISLISAKSYVVAFDFTSATLGGGSYDLNGFSLLLSGDADLADFSAQISATAPTSLALPDALVTLSSAGAGTLSASSASAYDFTPDASYVFSADTTYYLTFHYAGADTANWIATSTAEGSTSSGNFNYGTALQPVTSTITPGDNRIYLRQLQVGDGGYTPHFFDNAQGFNLGFAVTATVVPEPAAFAGLLGATALMAGLFVRRRRGKPPVEG